MTTARTGARLQLLGEADEDGVRKPHTARDLFDTITNSYGAMFGAGDYGALGDTSTLADPAVVDDLVENRQNKKG